MSTQIKPVAVDSVQILKDKLDSLQIEYNTINHAHGELTKTYDFVNEQLYNLCLRVDSAEVVANNYMVRQDYFGDIISSQLMWFTIILAVLAIGFSIGFWKPINKKLVKAEEGFGQFKRETLEEYEKSKRDIEIEIETSQRNLSQQFIKRTNQIRSMVINTLDNYQKELMEHREETRKSVNSTEVSMNILVEDTKNELNTLINEQENKFNNETKEILSNIRKIAYDSRRGMFFPLFENKKFNTALTWLPDIIQYVVENEKEEVVNAFFEHLMTCIKNLKFEKHNSDTFEEDYESVISEFEVISSSIEGEKFHIQLTTAIKELRHKLYSILKEEEMASKKSK